MSKKTFNAILTQYLTQSLSTTLKHSFLYAIASFILLYPLFLLSIEILVIYGSIIWFVLAYLSYFLYCYRFRVRIPVYMPALICIGITILASNSGTFEGFGILALIPYILPLLLFILPISIIIDLILSFWAMKNVLGVITSILVVILNTTVWLAFPFFSGDSFIPLTTTMIILLPLLILLPWRFYLQRHSENKK